MKLQGFHLSIPLCDWRTFLSPDSRIKALASLSPTIGRTGIKGFGVAKERSKLHLPWRAAETVYFDASRAISLPQRLPDDQPVDHTVRRLYIDARALIRFELAIFANPSHFSGDSAGRLDEFVRAFWMSSVVLRTSDAETTEPLATAISKLATNFAVATSVSAPRRDLCRELEPQLTITLAAAADELHHNSKWLNDTETLAISFQPVRVPHKSTALDTIYLSSPPGFITRPRDDEFQYRRLVRARIAWMHADLELLTHILRRCADNEVEVERVDEYLRKLAEGFWQAPRIAALEHRIFTELLTLLEEVHGNRLSRLVADLHTSALPLSLRDRLVDLLAPQTSRFVVTPSAGTVASSVSSVAETPVAFTPASLDSRIAETPVKGGSASQEAERDELRRRLTNGELPRLRYQMSEVGPEPRPRSVGDSDFRRLLDRPDVLLITTADVERDVVLRRLQAGAGDDEVPFGYIGQTTYYLGRLGGCRVAMIQCAQGSGERDAASLAVMNSVLSCQPRAVIGVGIAFGGYTDKLRIGDVLAPIRK